MKNIPSIRELKEICQSPVKGDDWVWHGKLLRPLSIRITRLLLYTPVSGNQVTMTWGIVGIIGATLLSFGNYWYAVIAIILLAFSMVLDHVDGEVARYRGQSSDRGVFLDLLFHSIVDSLVFISLSFGVYIISNNAIYFIFGFLASSSLLWRQVILQDKEWKGLRILLVKDGNHKKKRWKRIISKVPRGIWGHEVWIWIILAGTVFNFTYIVLIAYGIFLPIYAMIETKIYYMSMSKYKISKN